MDDPGDAGTVNVAESYKTRFRTSDRVREYQRIYGRNTYDSMLWTIERTQLIAALQREVADSSARALDFATGTGRILGALQGLYGDLTGIDVSPDMLSEARVAFPTANLIARDLSTGGSDDLGKFQVITTFRFVLNAGLDLRREILGILRSLIDESEGRLVVNNHGSSPSVHGYSHVWYLLQRMWKGPEAPRAGTVLRHRELLREFATAGFTLTQSYGCGLLGGRLYAMLPHGLADRFEGWAARQSVLERFCVNRLYVLRPVKPAAAVVAD